MVDRLNANEEAFNVARTILEEYYGGVSREIRRRIQETHAWPSIRHGRGDSAQLMAFRHFTQSLVSSLRPIAPSQLAEGSLYEILVNKLDTARRASYIRWCLDMDMELSVDSLNRWLKRESMVQSELSTFAIQTVSVSAQSNHSSPADSRKNEHPRSYHVATSSQGSSNTQRLVCIYCSGEHMISLW